MLIMFPKFELAPIRMYLMVLEDGVVEIRTTGSDPYLFTEPLGPSVDLQNRHVLAFEYFSAKGTDQMQVEGVGVTGMIEFQTLAKALCRRFFEV